MRSRSHPSAGDCATRIRQEPEAAEIEGRPSSGCSATVTEKCCLSRKSATAASMSRVEGGAAMIERATIFHPSVAARSTTRTSHLDARKYLTPSAYHSHRDHQNEHDRIGYHIAPVAMNVFVVAVAQSHDADPAHVDGDDRQAGKRAP